MPSWISVAWMPPRARTQSSKHWAAATRATPGGQGTTPVAAASSPPAAISAKRWATRWTCPSAPARNEPARELPHVLVDCLADAVQITCDLLQEGAGGGAVEGGSGDS